MRQLLDEMKFRNAKDSHFKIMMLASSFDSISSAFDLLVCKPFSLNEQMVWPWLHSIDFSIKSDCSFEMEIFRNFDEHCNSTRCREIKFHFAVQISVYTLESLSFKYSFIFSKEQNQEILEFSANSLLRFAKIVLNSPKVCWIFETFSFY